MTHHVARSELLTMEMGAREHIPVPFDGGEPLTHGAACYTTRPQCFGRPPVEEERKGAVHSKAGLPEKRFHLTQNGTQARHLPHREGGLFVPCVVLRSRLGSNQVEGSRSLGATPGQ